MPEIRKLPDHLVNLIAAGEVVERPASVVKELLENSLDAGASRIEIELESGGRKLVTVRDDGQGMDRHDLLLAIQRHATSKISSPSDLNTISTMGFRGEALPSIASVSRTTILSSRGEEGWKLVVSGGVMDSLDPAARSRGTTVTVENLFFNQPARRKFLRAESTELVWIERIVTGGSLSRCDCHFSLKHNGRELFTLPATESPAQRLRDRYDLASDEKCIEATAENQGVSVKLIVFPERRWADRRHLFVLVNGRPVVANLVSIPLREAFSGPAGNPLILCEISVDPSFVDVNVHPAKREVRFRKHYHMEAAIRAAITELTAVRAKSTITFNKSTYAAPYRAESPVNYYPSMEKKGNPKDFTGTYQLAMKFDSPQSEHTELPAKVPKTWEDSLEIIQISRSFLVTETAAGMLVVDQHAAHERILYEKILDNLHGAMSAGQQRMLIPEEIRVDEEAIKVLNLFRPMILQAGYDFRITGDVLELCGVPAGLKRGTDALLEVIKALSRGSAVSEPEAERIAAASACSGAIKFGDKISQAEAINLFNTLFTMKDPFHCPHGRPTMIELPFSELESRFGR